MNLSLSTLEKEGTLLVSKLLKIPVLLDEEDLENLFDFLLKQFSNFYIFPSSGLCQKDQEHISLSNFLSTYAHYVGFLKRGENPPPSTFRSCLSAIWTLNLDTVFAMEVGNDKRLIKPKKPIIQIQPHHFIYSQEDKKIRSMVFSKESITWGLHLTYPQLYQDAKTQDIYSFNDINYFPNTPFFKAIQKWIRDQTRATPFLIEGKTLYFPMRISKKALSWVGNHPQLYQKDIKVDLA